MQNLNFKLDQLSSMQRNPIERHFSDRLKLLRKNSPDFRPRCEPITPGIFSGPFIRNQLVNVIKLLGNLKISKPL